ncbi:hypothetical protein C1646_667222 [Rhizophagus diaphanus]|nr:hypothetical protein C1646_667222 [Rhizophagus diaphanus] [Rhizophagus sp. MUCL 43196]
MQHCQMNECLLYCVKKVENWKGDKVIDKEIDIQKIYSEDQEEKSYNEEENNNTDPIGMAEIIGNIKFAKNNYESMILNLNSLIKCINRTSIHEIWRVTTIEKNKEHFVVIFGNANHLCIYMHLITKGLVCRHFFSVMLNSNKIMFHIGLILARWYNSEMTNDPQKEAAITIFSKKSSSNDREFVCKHPIEPNFDILNEIRNVQMFSETVK